MVQIAQEFLPCELAVLGLEILLGPSNPSNFLASIDAFPFAHAPDLCGLFWCETFAYAHSLGNTNMP